MKHLKRLFNIDPWKLSTHSLYTKDLRLQESLTSIGNGYMGMRGNFEEGFSGDHHQGTYLAGVWYPDKTRVGWWKNGYPDYFGKVINAINFIAMDIYINDEKLDLNKHTPTDFYQELDMKTGILSRRFTVSVQNITVQLSFSRFLSATTKELAVINLAAHIIDGNGSIKVVSKLDNQVHNEDSNYDEMFWQNIDDGANFVTAQTVENPFGIDQFTVTALMAHTTEGFTQTSQDHSPLLATESFEYHVKAGDDISLTKKVIVLLPLPLQA